MYSAVNLENAYIKTQQKSPNEGAFKTYKLNVILLLPSHLIHR